LFSPPVVWLHIDLSNTVGIWDDVVVNGTGTLDMDEFKSGLENLGIRLGNGVVQDSFGDLDKGGTGEIHFEDFQAWWAANENRMRATAHEHTVNDSVRDTQKRVSNVEAAVGNLQSDMAKLLSVLRSRR
jgi:hypothetical protein